MRESPSAALSRNLRLIAESPRNVTALIAAGRAALDLGDYQSAVGFFGRAEEVAPSDPAPKIGMGAASAAMNDPRVALGWFAQAQRLGASVVAMGADRGLAHDLIGQQASAQADYRAALSGPDANEARRRLALSLAISRDAKGAMAVLQPLLNMRDPAAQRTRAFVLALEGDRTGARAAIEGAMPGSSARIDPFFMVLPSLSPEQKAAAVHLGVFPTSAEMRLVPVEPPRVAVVAPPVARPSAPPAATRGATAAPPRARTDSGRTARPNRSSMDQLDRRLGLTDREAEPVSSTSAQRSAQRLPSASVASVAPAVPSSATGQPVTVQPVVVGPPLPAPTVSGPNIIPSDALPSVAAPQLAEAPAATPPQSDTVSSEPDSAATADLAGDRLSGIDKLLAQAAEPDPPPASRPRAERSVPSAKKMAEAKRAAEAKKEAEAKKAAEKKEREAIGVAGTNWVQLAGGSNSERMATEFKKLAAKSSALRKRGGLMTKGKDYYRLLAGPFDSKSEAQAFVNQLAKDGVDGFSWTRTPATIKIEKLSPK